MISHAKYLYRLDRLDSLRAQFSDPSLRARRVTQAHGAFDHHQVLNELAKVPDSMGVYRFCFWKNWDALVKNMPMFAACESPWVIQRVRADHPVLMKFNKDDDEYLPSDAWIFWQSNIINQSRPDWSSNGIPHEDMDVLTPRGVWERLLTSELMRDPSFDNWRCFPLPGHNGPTPVFARMLIRRVDGGTEACVFLRQQIGVRTTIWRDPEILAQAVSLIFADLKAIGLSRVRWFFSIEWHDRILSDEFFPSFRMPKPSFMERMLRHARSGFEYLEVTVADRFELLDEDEQRLLYRDFGIGEALLLNKRYKYSDGILRASREADSESRPPSCLQ